MQYIICVVFYCVNSNRQLWYIEVQPGISGHERWRVAEKLAETSLKGLTDAVDNLAGSTLGTLQDVTR